MSQNYKGYTVPSYTDIADGPAAFKEFVDGMPSGLPPGGGGAGSGNNNPTAARGGSGVVIVAYQIG